MKQPNQDHIYRFQEVVDFVAKSHANGGIHGLQGSAAAFLVAAAATAGAQPIVIAAPDGEAASTWATDIRFYLGRDELFQQPLTDQVVRYPSSDLAPYSFVGFESGIWLNRMAHLFRLANGMYPQVMCVGLDALTRKVIPKRTILDAGFLLHTGTEIDRDELLFKLQAAGYSRSPLVEDAGDVSVRGFIIDVYSPMYPYPIRIEQLGDQIDTMRFFDPSNQRSKEAVSQVFISPIHMILPNSEELADGVQRIVQICEDRGIAKKVRQQLVEDFKHGIRFPGAEFYLPDFFEMRPLLEYLPPNAAIILPDSDTMNRVLDEQQRDVFRGWEEASADALPVPEPESLFLLKDELYARLEDFRRITMSPLHIAGEEQESYRVSSQSNSDIREELLRSKAYDASMSLLVDKLTAFRDAGSEVFLVSHNQGQAHRLAKLLEPYALDLDMRGAGFESLHLSGKPTPGIRSYVGGLSYGFQLPSAGRVVITEEEIFGSRVRIAPRKRARGSALTSLTDLVEGEAVVHEDYGIGIFRGLEQREFQGIAGEVMVIEYIGEDRLYLPVERLQVVQKYISGAEEPPRIDKLGGRGWEKVKARIKKSIRDMAKELLEVYAQRRLAHRPPYSTIDENYTAFEATFDYEETPDQAKAIQEVMEAMDNEMPLDRLVCGDAGYGKTEVAIRAAFRAVMDAKQVAVLVPTTILAQQHYDTFARRFENYPIKVAMLSRFRSAAEQKVVKHELAQGKVDIVIGTHKLLSKDIQFKDLGLLVIDEEQRFGVAHKERIRKYKANVDVLTLTATPIPRTLNMSLTGIRDLSVIETPPTNRQSIRTHVHRRNDDIVKEALTREINRGGQVFYLSNRVRGIERKADYLRKLVPEIKLGIAHGQMPEKELEKVMLDFVTGRINTLLCTSIIESGLDIPRANTIVVERADTFGLADLYQIRGRVGRSNMRAYAYLLTPSETAMTPDAVKRLAVIQEHSSLGQGFRIALRDMEIRGAGNILGASQSGHVAQVGYEMYLELLEEAVQEMKGEPRRARINPELMLKMEAYIPDQYTPDAQQRMNLYKRLSKAESEAEIDGIEDEIYDLYGKAPSQVINLIQIMRIRLTMKNLMITKLDYNDSELIFFFHEDSPVRPQFLAYWAQNDRRLKLFADRKFSYRVGSIDAEQRIAQSVGILAKLSKDVSLAETPEAPETPVIRLKKAGYLKN